MLNFYSKSQIKNIKVETQSLVTLWIANKSQKTISWWNETSIHRLSGKFKEKRSNES